MKDPQELLNRAAWIAKRVDGKLPRTISAGCRAAASASSRSRRTSRPSTPRPAAGRTTYLLNTYDLPSRPLYNLTALTLHEIRAGPLVPGRRWPRSRTGLPEFRREVYISAYGEGWALYCERLGVEMGMYDTPYDRFGMLTFQMWRAARLVVDTGVHHKGWTRAQAIAYLHDNTALADHDIEIEVDRYISWPGQALSYYLGMMAIVEARAKAEAALGPKFDIRAFHDTVLSMGSRAPAGAARAHRPLHRRGRPRPDAGDLAEAGEGRNGRRAVLASEPQSGVHTEYSRQNILKPSGHRFSFSGWGSVWPRIRRAVAACVMAVAMWPVGPAVAQPNSEALAAAIQAHAEAATFAQLKRFGDEAMKGRDVEALRRLQYAASVFRNQSEFELFDRYNSALAQAALRLHDRDYMAIAALNRLAAKYDQGDDAAAADLKAAHPLGAGWFAESYRQTLRARLLIDGHDAGAALKLLSATEQTIPQGDPDAAAAESDIWETIGLALMQLDDLEGSAKAFQRADIEFTDPGLSAARLRRRSTTWRTWPSSWATRSSAAQLVAIHHRLTERVGPAAPAGLGRRTSAAMVAEAFRTPADVMALPAGPRRQLTGAEFLAPKLLPMRAIAEARLGDVAGGDSGPRRGCAP